MGTRFKKEGTSVYLWLLHVDTCQKPAQHCKAIIFLLKINLNKKIKCDELFKKKNKLPRLFKKKKTELDDQHEETCVCCGSLPPTPTSPLPCRLCMNRDESGTQTSPAAGCRWAASMGRMREGGGRPDVAGKGCLSRFSPAVFTRQPTG